MLLESQAREAVSILAIERNNVDCPERMNRNNLASQAIDCYQLADFRLHTYTTQATTHPFLLSYFCHP